MTPRKTPRAKTSMNKILRLHIERNPGIPFGTAYDDTVAYVRRTQQPPKGPRLAPDGRSSLTGITDEHALSALKMAAEAAKYNDYDITELDAAAYAAWLRWA